MSSDFLMVLYLLLCVLRVLCSSALHAVFSGRLVLGFTLTSTYCVSQTTEHGHVLNGHSIQLQRKLILRWVTGEEMWLLSYGM